MPKPAIAAAFAAPAEVTPPPFRAVAPWPVSAEEPVKPVERTPVADAEKSVPETDGRTGAVESETKPADETEPTGVANPVAEPIPLPRPRPQQTAQAEPAVPLPRSRPVAVPEAAVAAPVNDMSRYRPDMR